MHRVKAERPLRNFASRKPRSMGLMPDQRLWAGGLGDAPPFAVRQSF
jgi:hypothetical protein